jgi:hypothetical protein
MIHTTVVILAAYLATGIIYLGNKLFRTNALMHYRRGDGAHWLIPMTILWPLGAYDNIRWDDNPKAVGYLLLPDQRSSNQFATLGPG